MLPVFVSLSKSLNQLNDFHKTLYKHRAIGCHPNVILISTVSNNNMEHA
jgi:hypothetical protein